MNVRRMVISPAIALEDFFSCPTVCELLVAALGWGDPEPMFLGEPGPALHVTSASVRRAGAVTGGQRRDRHPDMQHASAVMTCQQITFGKRIRFTKGLHYYCMVGGSQISGQFVT